MFAIPQRSETKSRLFYRGAASVALKVQCVKVCHLVVRFQTASSPVDFDSRLGARAFSSVYDLIYK